MIINFFDTTIIEFKKSFTGYITNPVYCFEILVAELLHRHNYFDFISKFERRQLKKLEFKLIVVKLKVYYSLNIMYTKTNGR